MWTINLGDHVKAQEASLTENHLMGDSPVFLATLFVAWGMVVHVGFLA